MAERTTHSRSRKPFLWYLGRWAWVFLIGEVTLLLFVPVFFKNKWFHTQLIAAVAAVAIGTFCALLTRSLIAKFPLFMRIFYPFPVLIICLVLINWITAGQGGFGFLHDPLYGSPWWGLIPLAAGTIAATLTLLAWKKSRKKKAGRRAAPRPASVHQRTAPQPSRPAGNENSVPVSSAAIQAASTHATNPGGSSTFREAAASRLHHSADGAEAPADTLRVAKRKTKNNHLRLVGAEEHRCPYCLEVVKPRDPRGVVICDICHAYHHRDCWEVTGRCQVPHQSIN